MNKEQEIAIKIQCVTFAYYASLLQASNTKLVSYKDAFGMFKNNKKIESKKEKDYEKV